MGVKVRIAAMFQSATGGVRMTEVDCATVGACLKELTNQFPAMKKMIYDEGDKFSGYLNVSVNGQHVQEDLNSFLVKPGDEIYPMILIEGG